MIELLFVGDGKRDSRTIPPIVAKFLCAQIEPRFLAWRELRLHTRLGKRARLSGYSKKLLFALSMARDMGLVGVVATVDRDTPMNRTDGGRSRRLADLKKGRDADRTRAHATPTALGEAIPHLEAWLLDDCTAVRNGLNLDSEAQIPNVAKIKDPKQQLQFLIAQSPRAQDDVLDVLSDIARLVDCGRCNHRKRSGFKRFEDDVRRELGPIVPRSPRSPQVDTGPSGR